MMEWNPQDSLLQLQRKIADNVVIKRSQLWKPAGFRASEAGHLCARYQYHAMKDWQLRPSPDERLAHIFSLGIALEGYVSDLLAESGVRLKKQQMTLGDKDLGVVGRIDGTIDINGYEAPVEIKSVNQYDWESIGSWKDMVSEDKPFLMRWSLQLPLYLYLSNREFGVYVLLNKSTGQLKLVPVWLTEAYDLLMEYNDVLSKAKAALADGSPPPPEPRTRAMCSWCWAKQVALCPGVEELQPLEVDMTAVAEAAAEVAKLREIHRQYEDAQKRLSKLLEPLQVNPGEKLEFLAGIHPIRVVAYETTRYNVPEDVKKQYATKAVQRRIEVVA